MITAKQAIAEALQAISPRIPPERITDIVAEPVATGYAVRLSLLAGPDEPQARVIAVTIDQATGAPLGMTDGMHDNPVTRLSPAFAGKQIISGPRALALALNAIKGYEHYDPYGRLTVQLRDDHYSVIFPEPGADANARSADYTYDVWIDPLSGAVIKVSTSS